MISDEFKKACEGCETEEELKVVIDLHRSELTNEELQQVSGGIPNVAEMERWSLKFGGILTGRTLSNSTMASEATLREGGD